MSAIIQRTKAVLSDPDESLTQKVHMIGVLAMAIIVCNDGSPEYEEARQLVIAFWGERQVAA